MPLYRTHVTDVTATGCRCPESVVSGNGRPGTAVERPPQRCDVTVMEPMPMSCSQPRTLLPGWERQHQFQPALCCNYDASTDRAT